MSLVAKISQVAEREGDHFREFGKRRENAPAKSEQIKRMVGMAIACNIQLGLLYPNRGAHKQPQGRRMFFCNGQVGKLICCREDVAESLPPGTSQFVFGNSDHDCLPSALYDLESTLCPHLL